MHNELVEKNQLQPGQTTCALINFKTTESALEAVRTIKFHLRNINDEIVSSGDKNGPKLSSGSSQDTIKNLFNSKQHQVYLKGKYGIVTCLLYIVW